MSQDEPTTGSENPLAQMGLTPAQSLALPNLNQLFNLEDLDGAVAASGWSAAEHASELIQIARGAAKPTDRMTAMRDLMKLVRESIEINKPQVTVTRKSEYINESGQKITDTVAFTDRYREAPAASHRIHSTYDELDEGDDSDD